MNDNNKEYFKINFAKKKTKDAAFCLRVIGFMDGNSHIVYIPSLNLSGYGDTLAEAREMLENVVLNDYIRRLMDLPESQIMSELREYGWVRRPFLPKELRNTKFLSHQALRESFDLPEETQFHEQFMGA